MILYHLLSVLFLVFFFWDEGDIDFFDATEGGGGVNGEREDGFMFCWLVGSLRNVQVCVRGTGFV